MQWLGDILKNLNGYKTLVASIFGTTVVMHVGAMWTPLIPRVPDNVAPFSFGLMVLTGFLVLSWSIGAVTTQLKTLGKAGFQAIAARKLTPDEMSLLDGMGRRQGRALDLDDMPPQTNGVARLEIELILQSLVKKGLVTENVFDGSMYYLTKAGKERAVKTHYERLKSAEHTD